MGDADTTLLPTAHASARVSSAGRGDSVPHGRCRKDAVWAWRMVALTWGRSQYAYWRADTIQGQTDRRCVARRHRADQPLARPAVKRMIGGIPGERHITQARGRLSAGH
jgi:hypothetical protein